MPLSPLHTDIKRLLPSVERNAILLVRICVSGTCNKYLYYLIKNEQISSTTAVLMQSAAIVCSPYVTCTMLWRPGYSSGGWSPASHRGSPGSIPDHMWNL